MDEKVTNCDRISSDQIDFLFYRENITVSVYQTRNPWNYAISSFLSLSLRIQIDVQVEAT